MNFADKIFQLRNNARLSQEEMAAKFDVSRQTVYKWESGRSYPDIDKLIQISEEFSISIDYLLKDNYNDESNFDDLERHILEFLGLSKDMDKMSEKLIYYIRDGHIDSKEMSHVASMLEILERIKSNMEDIKKTIIKRQEK